MEAIVEEWGYSEAARQEYWDNVMRDLILSKVQDDLDAAAASDVNQASQEAAADDEDLGKELVEEEDQGEDDVQVMANVRIDDADYCNDHDLAGDLMSLEGSEELCEVEACAREDILKEHLEQNGMKIEYLKAAMIQQRLDLETQTAGALILESLLAESRDLETSVMARNSKLSEQVSANKAECNQLHASLVSALESKQALKEQVEQLKASLKFWKEKAEKAQSIHEDYMYELVEDFLSKVTEVEVEQHKLETDKLNKTISDLENEKNELSMNLALTSASLEHLRAMSFENEEAKEKLEESKQALEEQVEQLKTSLESEKEKAEKALSILEDDKSELSEEFLSKVREVEQHKLENYKLNKTIYHLENEKNLLRTNLGFMAATLEHFQAMSSEYEEAKEKLEEEKEMLLSELQIAKESVEFHQKVLHEYDFV